MQHMEVKIPEKYDDHEREIGKMKKRACETG